MLQAPRSGVTRHHSRQLMVVVARMASIRFDRSRSSSWSRAAIAKLSGTQTLCDQVLVVQTKSAADENERNEVA
jgi:hypothetical protein